MSSRRIFQPVSSTLLAPDQKGGGGGGGGSGGGGFGNGLSVNGYSGVGGSRSLLGHSPSRNGTNHHHHHNGSNSLNTSNTRRNSSGSTSSSAEGGTTNTTTTTTPSRTSSHSWHGHRRSYPFASPDTPSSTTTTPTNVVTPAPAPPTLPSTTTTTLSEFDTAEIDARLNVVKKGRLNVGGGVGSAPSTPTHASGGGGGHRSPYLLTSDKGGGAGSNGGDGHGPTPQPPGSNTTTPKEVPKLSLVKGVPPVSWDIGPHIVQQQSSSGRATATLSPVEVETFRKVMRHVMNQYFITPPQQHTTK
eukprot:PhF_6_TR40372/c0_g1_i2/m.60114